MGNATQSAVPNVVYRFGLFVLAPASGSLTRNGMRVRLQDQPFRLLTLLVQRPGEVVSREEIQHALWPANTFVEFDKSLGVAVLKVREALADDAGNPRFIQTVPRRGYRFIAPVSIDAVSSGPAIEAAPLDASSAAIGSIRGGSESVARHAPWPVWYRAILTAVAMSALGFGVYRIWLRQPVPPPAPRAASGLHVRRSVAVLGFRNLPGHPEDNWLSPAFAEMLNTELAADGAVRIISGEDVARSKRELPLADEDSLASDTLKRLRKNPGADVVVLGSYTLLPGKGEKRIRLDVRLQDTARGETIAEKAFVGDEGHLFELVSEAGAALRQSLGSTPVSGESSAQARAALPASPQAIRLYTEGKSRLWAFDFVQARDLLIQAVAVEPDFPLSHAALSDAWDHLGYSLKAREEAERARSLSGHLGPEDRLQIDAQYDSSLGDWKDEAAAYDKLFSQFPDSLNYGLQLADAQRRLRSDDALKTLMALRRLPAPQGDDPRIDMVEARVWMDRDYGKVQALGRRAVEKGTAQGSTLLVARAYGILCEAVGNGSSSAEAAQDCERAREGYAAAGDRNNEARTLNDFASLYYQLGDVAKAQTMFQQALAVFREVGDIEGLTVSSSNLGDVYLAKGDLDEASRAISDVIPGYKEMGDEDGVALALNDLGEIARRRGNLKQALASYEQAKTAAQQIDDKRALAYVLSGMGNVFEDRGEPGKARNFYEQSLQIRKQSGEKQAVAETELALALLALGEDKAADAETVIRKCKQQFHQDQDSDDELAAGIALIKALLAQARYSDARNEADASMTLASTWDEVLRLRFAIASASVEGASGHFDAAQTKLEDAIHQAHAHNLLEIEFEGRLARADFELRAGRKSQGRTDLLSLEEEAHAKGFGKIVARANTLSAEAEPPRN